MITHSEDAFEKRWDAMPEGKLELINGQLIISTLAGSRRIAWHLLDDYGPPIGLAHAPAQLWWSALEEAFGPYPRPATRDEWWRWAKSFRYSPEPPHAGPQFTGEHYCTYGVLKWGLHYFAEASRLGRSFGRDFVVRLEDDGLTPDQTFVDRERLAYLCDLYLDGSPTIAIEVVQPGSETQDRSVKRLLYERAKVPEYWLFDAFSRQATFLQWCTPAGYREAKPDADGIYRSTAVPGLALSLPELWSMKEADWRQRWRPFLPCPSSHKDPLPALHRGKDDLHWDSVPFGPRVGLKPCRIRFEEFGSWCGRAKFESYGGGLKIDGWEATRRIFGMLLMTFGLVDIVKLAHPRDWVLFLEPGILAEQSEQHIRNLLGQAVYEAVEGIRSEKIYRGEVPGNDALCAYADSEVECRRELAEATRNWVRLRLARGEKLLGAGG